MNRLKELRKDKNKSQKEIAELLEVNEKTISRWEKGERPIKTDKAQQLADYFGVSVGYLLGYEESQQNVEDFMLKHSDNIETTADFLGYIMLSSFKGINVAEKIIKNVQFLHDYDYNIGKEGEEFKSWDKEAQEQYIEMHKQHADKMINSLLYGICTIPNDIRFALMDFLSLDIEKQNAISEIIKMIADNPLYIEENEYSENTQED